MLCYAPRFHGKIIPKKFQKKIPKKNSEKKIKNKNFKTISKNVMPNLFVPHLI
jgi:hypothetical protein